MALASLSNQQLVRHIDTAQRRVAFMAPGLHLEVSRSLCEAWKRLGPNAVSVILDTRPEVFRLGYGTFEALELLSATAEELGTMVCQQEGVQVGVLVADDLVAVFAPKPLMVSASDLDEGEVNGIVLDLQNPVERVAEQIGATNSLLGQEFGLDPVPRKALEAVKADLDQNPPQKFDVFRKVNVFNAMFEFVELELKGSQITRKEVTLPTELSAISSDEVRRKLKTSYRLIDANAEIAKAQDEVTQLRKEIEKRFLRVVPGHGMAVMRKERDLFDQALEELKTAVLLFQGIVDSELTNSIEVSIDEIARAIVPGIAAANPSKEFMTWARFRQGKTVDDYVRWILRDCFQDAAKDVQRMSVNAIFKAVTYESLKDEKFLAAARKAFPELEDIFVEFEAARGSAVEGENGTK